MKPIAETTKAEVRKLSRIDRISAAMICVSVAIILPVLYSASFGRLSGGWFLPIVPAGAFGYFRARQIFDWLEERS